MVIDSSEWSGRIGSGGGGKSSTPSCTYIQACITYVKGTLNVHIFVNVSLDGGGIQVTADNLLVYDDYCYAQDL